MLDIELQKSFMKVLKYNWLIILILSSKCLSQDVFQYSKEHKFLKFHSEQDFTFLKFSIIGGLNWIEFSKNISKDSENTILTDPNLVSRFGLLTNNSDVSLYLNHLFFYSKNFYSYLDAKVVSDVYAFDNFSGIPKGVKRFGFEGGDVNQSGIGFRNDFFMAQYGRGKQNWGAGDNIELALSNDSFSYDHFVFELRKNIFKYRYFHGFLENIDKENRYLLGKGIEYSNHKNLRLAFAEIVIYSGENRPLDLNYLNPISSHLEIETNARGNKPGNDLGNAVWNVSFDYKINHNMRLMSNFLIDELTIDKIERDQGKTNGLATSSKIIYRPNVNGSIYYSLSYVTVGTKTFRHKNLRGNGYYNFVHSNSPLGWSHGSDTQMFSIEFNQNIGNKILNRLEISYFQVGDESITSNGYEPYEDYLKSSFPSGSVEKFANLIGEVDYYIKHNISIKMFSKFTINKNKLSYNYNLMIDYFFDSNI